MHNLLLSTLVVAALILTSCTPKAITPAKTEEYQIKRELAFLDKKPPEFSDLIWVNSKPLTLAALKGKPVFVRFWSGNCEYCEHTIPTLNYLHNTYGSKGLTVIGICYPDNNFPLTPTDKLARIRKQFGIEFPIALDIQDSTKNKYTPREFIDYSSTSVLINRKGIVTWEHPGGELSLPVKLGGKGSEKDFDSLIQEVEKAIAEKP